MLEDAVDILTDMELLTHAPSVLKVDQHGKYQQKIDNEGQAVGVRQISEISLLLCLIRATLVSFLAWERFGEESKVFHLSNLLLSLLIFPREYDLITLFLATFPGRFLLYRHSLYLQWLRDIIFLKYVSEKVE